MGRGGERSIVIYRQVKESIEEIGNGPDMTNDRWIHGCGIFHSSQHGGRPILVIAGGVESSTTSEHWDFTVPDSKWQQSSQDLPTSMAQPRMASTGDGKQLIMTYEKGVYSFHCDTSNQCYWNTVNHELGISRQEHIMMTIPTSLVEHCGCELDSTGDCKCPAAVTGQKCDRCKDGYWGLIKNDVM